MQTTYRRAGDTVSRRLHVHLVLVIGQLAAQTGCMGVRGPAWRSFVEHIRTTHGRLPATDRAAALDATATPGNPPSGEVEEFVAKVAERSYAVTDGDITRLRDLEISEDEILELVIAASVGAGDRRWRAVYGK